MPCPAPRDAMAEAIAAKPWRTYIISASVETAPGWELCRRPVI